jgi:lipoate-protein ligase A
MGRVMEQRGGFFCLHLQGRRILDQLHLEEYLLRDSVANWCIIAEGSSEPSVVLGVSAQTEEWVDRKEWEKKPIRLIKRFTGGGTVVVDEKTLFITLILNGEEFGVQPIPQELLQWTGGVYREVFGEKFAIRENDYIFCDGADGGRKFGGNAQYFKRQRYVHHTSFLFAYEPDRMRYLKHPRKQPEYRQERKHGDFLTTLVEHGFKMDTTIENFKRVIHERFGLLELNPEPYCAAVDAAILEEGSYPFRTHCVTF